MSIEQNKAIARLHFEEVHNSGRVDLMDKYYALDIPAGEWNSREEYESRILWWRKVAPDMHLTVVDMVAEGDKVYVYVVTKLTYSVVPDPVPSFPMPPFGKPVEFRSVEMLRFADGKLVDADFVIEWMRMMVEAGVYGLENQNPASQ